MKKATVLGLLLVLITAAFAGKSDDSLRFFLSKSDLVVLGKMTSEPAGIVDELGVVNYICEFQVSEILKGKKLAENTIRVNIVRFERDKDDRLPEMTKGYKCILFLKKEVDGTQPPWRTADVWFGVQRPSPWLARSLKRLSAASK